MLRLGNIDYSNCYPIHGSIAGPDRPSWLEVVDGPPSELNRLLATGELDVAPGSSIELARHNREYRALSGLCIGSDGPVESIIVSSRFPLEELDGRRVALPTASASSRSLLRILLERRYGIRPHWIDFDQRTSDPMADAALFIGDVALRLPARQDELRYDLGREWTAWTGLPFVYAVWMVRDEAAGTPELRELHRLFLAGRDELPAALESLATEGATRFDFTTDRLIHYWSRIRYDLTDAMIQGLEHFLELAADLGDAPRVRHLRFID